jgi:hypothetical protein
MQVCRIFLKPFFPDVIEKVLTKFDISQKFLLKMRLLIDEFVKRALFRLL